MFVLRTCWRIVHGLFRFVDSWHVSNLINFNSRARSSNCWTVSWRFVLVRTWAVTGTIAGLNWYRRITWILLCNVAVGAVVWRLYAVISLWYTWTVVWWFYGSLRAIIWWSRWVCWQIWAVARAIIWFNIGCIQRLMRITIVRTLSKVGLHRWWLYVSWWLVICVINWACVMVVNWWLYLKSIAVSRTLRRSSVSWALSVKIWWSISWSCHQI